jgi:hypothetical protein
VEHALEEIALSPDEIVAALRRECDDAGSVSAWARSHAMAPASVHDVLKRRIGVSAPLARRLGFKRVIRYVPLEG